MATLKDQLKGMLADARRTGVRQKRLLTNGLLVAVEQEQSGDVFLGLARLNVEPGEREWATVLKHWPEPLPVEPPQPVLRRDGRWHIMTARWPRSIGLFSAGEQGAPA